MARYGKKLKIREIVGSADAEFAAFVEELRSFVNVFIEGSRKVCSDGRARLFVPEVNSGEEDLKAVVSAVITE